MYARDPLGSTISLDHRCDTTSSIRDPWDPRSNAKHYRGIQWDPRSTVEFHHGIRLDHGSNAAFSREIFWVQRSVFGIHGHVYSTSFNVKPKLHYTWHPREDIDVPSLRDIRDVRGSQWSSLYAFPLSWTSFPTRYHGHPGYPAEYAHTILENHA